MNIKEMMKIPSLKDVILLSGQDGINNLINSVNVLEALDIENWGRDGEVILTSFFALNDLNNNELNSFFKKMKEIGISAIIIKIDRLVTNIPNEIIKLCNELEIPLIKINKTVKYESIILDILGPIINRNAYLLDKYYTVHSELTNLAMTVPSIEGILYEFKKMINKDITIINVDRNTEVSTNPLLSNVTILGDKQIINPTYTYFKYQRKTVIYNNTSPKITASQIRVPIPYLGFNDYELIVHELEKEINSEDFMVLENAVKFLQMELLNKYSISQNIFQQKNNIIGDLINDRIYDKKDIDEILESFGLDKYNNYQIVLIKLYQKDRQASLEKISMSPILIKIRNRFKLAFKSMAFLERSDRVVFIFNFSEKNNNSTLKSIENIMDSLENNDIFKDFYYKISISNIVKRYDLPKANKEALDTQKVLNLFHNSNKIFHYEELGIYKIFLETNNLTNVERFISPKINDFREKHPQLFETLEVFLNSNQSYLATSEKLFLHPKTVRYRIDKIKNLLNLDFNDQEEILQIQVASRLFKLKNQEDTNDK
ncbi:PucR family transcriptional regulator [Clostridium sp. Sa3CUN1]|uniref:PucR family transcriptional regulator n=1 Tax=Clostridium gallinarum TaxID=2762246 RepID=A0ABR8Q2G1_9CLOT|nr:PucR family transcriptional regulator [Clostridium gallinarum]MBD7914613.1 PucR family transcriptional regulator [Clostridium gallinarum]